MANQAPRSGRAHIHAEMNVQISWTIEDARTQPSANEWDEQFESLLRPRLPFLAADEPLNPDLDLRVCGLDSLGVVDLLVALESAYGVRLSEEAMSMDTFTTPGVLWNTLSKVHRVTGLSVSHLKKQR